MTDFEARMMTLRVMHPPLPQPWLEDAVRELTEIHPWENHEAIIPTTPCVLLALINEILLYRNQYGWLILPAHEGFYQSGEEPPA